MAATSISESYRAVCGEQGVKINPFVLENLEKTTTQRISPLKLAANRKQKDLQKLCDADVLALSKCLQNYRTFTGLDLRYNHIGEGGAAHLAELLQGAEPALRSLDLTLNNIGAGGAAVLASSLQGNRTLLSLRLSGNQIGDSGGVRLAGMLRLNRTLQELELADCHLELQSLIALSAALKNNPTLRSLDLSRPLLFSLQEEWAVHLSAALAANGGLVELHLGKAGLTDGGVERLAEGLRQNRSLQYLDLRCNRLTQDGALHLAGVLKQGSALQVVDLSSNRIEDVGAEYLSGAICWPGCPLTEISVCRNNIRTKGLLSLARALTHQPTLSHVYIWGNHLEAPVCQAFGELIASGRLAPRHTDVRPYAVDGRAFLAEVPQRLRKHVHHAD